MKRVKFVIALALMLVATSAIHGQVLAPEEAAPKGALIYSLPSTTISLKVEACREEFIAGPYAQYAQKYIGSPAKTTNETTHTLERITLSPFIEADPSVRIAINLAGKLSAPANFLQLCSQGLVVMSDSYVGKDDAWRFPTIAANDQFAGKGVEGNLTNATTTLYKSVKTDAGFQRVSVTQNSIVEKSLEMKAQETAEAIYSLRKKRVQIITGDTDATFSGEALEAAVKEITRLESEYLELFYGVTHKSTQEMTFDVVPSADNAKQMYVAFRVSDSEGLIPANNMGGRPIILELMLDQNPGGGESLSTKGDAIIYRVPTTATAKIVDGQKILLQSRVPVYQLGQIRSFPINTILK